MATLRLMPALDSLPVLAFVPRSVPGWAIPRGPVTSEVEAAFLAGSALNSLDNLVHAAPPWAGAWRQRLALRSAAAACALVGRAEDEAALRDAWHLRQTGDELGPAGNIFAAWRRLVVRAPAVDAATIRAVCELLEIRWDDGRDLFERVESLARSAAPAPLVAAAVVSMVRTVRPDADLLGWWLADQVLAICMHWPVPVPLFIIQARGAAFRGEGRVRVCPGDEGFARAMCIALALASTEACRVAGEIGARAARLEAVAPKLRAKGAKEVLRLLLNDDAIAGTLRTTSLSRWGSRRLFERLVSLSAARELTGRSTFRLYGL